MKVFSILLAILVAAWATPVLAQTCPPTNWCSGTYQYDGMGNIRAIGNDTYIYDTAGRIVSGMADVQRTGVMSRQDYGYDAFGNRINASRASGSVDCLGGCEQSLTIDPATNHITGNGAVYDAAGNLISITNTVNGTSFTSTYDYDATGGVTRATAGSGDDRQFVYTADGERIAVKNGQSWTWTVRGLDGKVLREFTSTEQNGLPTANWQWAKDYVWRDGLLLATVAPTTPGASTTVTRHFHLDHLGTPRLVTDDNGMQIGIHSYYPFGAELNLAPSEQPSELMKFTGHERDLLASNPNTLDYMHARYDMSTMGRFLSIDPVLDVKETVRAPQLWNRYVYVMNNPLRFTDPTGREHVAEPGFTKPLSEADWSDAPPVIKAAFYAEGGLLAMSALRAAGAGLNTLALNVLVRFATMGGGAAATAEGLRRAAEGGGPTTTVVTNLTRAPAEGRALSAAVGEGAQALASAARSGEGVKTFAAQIPQALIKGLEAAKLLSISTTQMNGVQATEYRFAPAAAEYIIKFFKEMK